jgi:aminopeptidase N
VVWLQIVATLNSINRLYAGNPGHAAFTAFALEMLRPLAGRLGWEAQAKEESNAALLRNAVLVALSAFGDRQVIDEARRLFEIARRNAQEVSPGTRQTVLTIVAHQADAAALDRLIARLHAASDPLEKQITFTALQGIADPAGAQRVLELAIGPDALTGTTSGILTGVAAAHPDLAWSFAQQHPDELRARLSSSDRLSLMPSIASNSSDLKRAADLTAYADRNIPAGARQRVEAAIATINLNAKFKAERIPDIDRWLASRATH